MTRMIRAVDAGRVNLADSTKWDWTATAACRGEDPKLFFGPDGERQTEREIREEKALMVCASCPVATREACLDAALAYKPAEQHGVQGGMTAEQRVREHRNRGRRIGEAA